MNLKHGEHLLRYEFQDFKAEYEHVGEFYVLEVRNSRNSMGFEVIVTHKDTGKQLSTFRADFGQAFKAAFSIIFSGVLIETGLLSGF